MTPDTELDRLFAKPFPEIAPPASLCTVDCTGLLLGNTDIEINDPEAVGLSDKDGCHE